MPTPPTDTDRLPSLKTAYIGILVVEAVVLIVLWWLGRIFS